MRRRSLQTGSFAREYLYYSFGGAETITLQGTPAAAARLFGQL
jgi:hypothetical protein